MNGPTCYGCLFCGDRENTLPSSVKDCSHEMVEIGRCTLNAPCDGAIWSCMKCGFYYCAGGCGFYGASYGEDKARSMLNDSAPH